MRFLVHAVSGGPPSASKGHWMDEHYLMKEGKIIVKCFSASNKMSNIVDLHQKRYLFSYCWTEKCVYKYMDFSFIS